MSARHLLALRDERQAVLDFCADLSVADLAAPSAAPGWSVADVVIHLTVTARMLVTPTAFALATTRDVERLNSQLVDAGRSHSTKHVTAEFTKWSGRGCAALTVLTAPGIDMLRFRLGELGWYPLRLVPAMLVFDWHTHLRHDLAVALDRPIPPTDPRRMASVLTWLTALLERSHREALSWLDAPVALTLAGPGGGSWCLEPHDGRVRVRPGPVPTAAARISGLAAEFPLWGTRRLPWRSCAVAVTGDTELGARVLDSINLV
ncbi:maleylpyruvate isomerase N-terminal domain-containing protein [Nocardia blacklockiae]|uniref:maleylpyruvate isomerase N-terminal domain-containing protein n=1 Tax=Nocardia blacklockiae TaxID=480036 RepID=UPI0018963662|nr:maleylpyruvate isomerase N-terminal domain-containing protein [Nocardia blacklockiae]MBF6174796.1 maleylpyruvate isomerase N-terminal domain-containing protein [Nocardia blacklockiae]